MIRLLCLGLVAGLTAFAAQDAAAQSCRFQEMRVLQLQASGSDSAALREARALLDACMGRGPPPETWSPNRGGSNWGNWGRNLGRDLLDAVTPDSRPHTTSPGGVRRGGTLRTWCVRRCDGYYFPISFSTSRDRLETDAAMCRGLCPAGDAELFFHYLHGEGPEQMQSLTGEAYVSLETAFSYRTALNENCACGDPAILQSPAASQPIVAALDPTRIPRPRPAIGRDPETALNSLGGFALDIRARGVADAYVPAGASDGAETSSVRIILPHWDAEAPDVMLSPVPQPTIVPN